ncbi:energy-coupling factor transporter ATPase [Vallitalea okinawensis]|uniref:energy-coupling factor transporter ATPase n=1 Tax=Vallitalea okinawensis TaxID=2078660 RepID=UPI000CFDB517|nr:energy-coupling factor transporter ATPase [Vallitalea okinawensis]
MDKIVSSKGLVYEYLVHNEFGEVEDKKRAIDQVDLEVEQGEFIVILGHNGSGKSTLAKHINALLHPTEGTLLVKGLDTSDQNNIWDIRQSAGMVFQNPDNQIIATIVEEDVAFGPENLGVHPAEIRRRVDESLMAVDMYHYKDHSPNKLSGGQKQRIAIAGVLAMRPECIILDEPTAMLDPSGRQEVMDAVLRLNEEEGITIIHITHYMEEAIRADRVIVMEEGRVVKQGRPKEVFAEVELMKNLGLDVPQVTEVAYELNNLGIEISQEILSIDEMVNAICQLKQKV